MTPPRRDVSGKEKERCRLYRTVCAEMGLVTADDPSSSAEVCRTRGGGRGDLLCSDEEEVVSNVQVGLRRGSSRK